MRLCGGEAQPGGLVGVEAEHVAPAAAREAASPRAPGTSRHPPQNRAAAGGRSTSAVRRIEPLPLPPPLILRLAPQILVRGGGTPTACSATAPAVRNAAYRALAVAARGRSRLSRAILARSRWCRALHCLCARQPLPRPRRRQQGGDTEERRPGGLAGRAKVLGRLVPGCRSLSLPALLAEVSDYIAALEMQVRAMGQLTHDLASSAAPSIAPP